MNKVLCVLHKLWEDKKDEGKVIPYFTEKTMNFDNKSFSVLRNMLPESKFEIYSTKVDNKLGTNPNCKATEINANVPNLIRKLNINTVVFCGNLPKEYHYMIK